MSEVYDVRTEYTVDDRGASTRLRAIVGGIRSVGSAARNALGSLFSLRGAVAGIGIAAGAQQLARRVLEIGSAAETSRIALGGMMQAGGATSSWNQSLQVSDALIERMRVHARELPGSFEDLQNVLGGGLAGGLGAGQSVAEIEALSARLMAVQRMRGIDSAQGGRDFGAILEGRAGVDVRTYSALRSQIGMTADEFNRLTPQRRFEVLSRAISGYDDAVRAYGNSWEAVSSTTRDMMTDLFRSATQPLFEGTRNTLAQVNQQLERAIPRAQALARTGVTRAMGFGREMFGIARTQGAGGLIDALSRRMAGVSTTGAAAVGMGIGGPAGGIAAAALATLARDTDAVNQIFTELRTQGQPVLRLVTSLGEQGGRLTAAVLPGLISGMGRLVGPVTDLVTQVGPAATTLGRSLGSLATTVGSVAGMMISAVGPLVGALAQATAWILDTTVGRASRFFNEVDQWMDSSRANMANDAHLNAQQHANVVRAEGIRAIAAMAQGQHYIAALNQLPQANRERVLQDMSAMAQRFANQPTLQRMMVERALNLNVNTILQSQQRAALVPPPNAAQNPLDARSNNTRAQRGNTHVTNNVTIQQTIERADDPDRVLRATRTALEDTLMHPVASPEVVVTR